MVRRSSRASKTIPAVVLSASRVQPPKKLKTVNVAVSFVVDYTLATMRRSALRSVQSVKPLVRGQRSVSRGLATAGESVTKVCDAAGADDSIS